MPVKAKRLLRILHRVKALPRHLKWLLFIAFIGLFAPLISNDVPIIAKIEDDIRFPIFEKSLHQWGWTNQFVSIENIDWTNTSMPHIMPLVPYTAKAIDIKNGGYLSPFDAQRISSWRYRHWLGTDDLGRDCLAGIIIGCRVSFLSALLIGITAGGLGLGMGMLAGYFGNNKLKIQRSKWIALLTCGVIFIYTISLIVPKASAYYTSESDKGPSILMLFFVSLLLIFLLYQIIYRGLNHLIGSKLKEDRNIPLDHYISRFIDIVKTIPALLLITAILALFRVPPPYIAIFLIALLTWVHIALLIRAETMTWREENFIKSIEAMDMSKVKILLRYLWPLVSKQFITALLALISGAIILQSSLSFLGIGIEIGFVDWGTMLYEAKNNIRAWWLALFPGIFLVLTIQSLYRWAEK